MGIKKLCLVAVLVVYLFQNRVFAEPIQLKMALFVPDKHVQFSQVIEPWARRIEDLSDGRLKINLYPGGELVSPRDQYDAVQKGDIDLSFGLPGYTPGKFPLTSAIRLPFLVRSAEKGSIVLWDTYKRFLQEEYKDVKILWLFCHGPGQLHTTKKQVKTLDDLKGLRIRTPDPLVSKVLERLGAVPVKKPITEAYDALAEGSVDGVVAPWEVMRPFKFYEYCKYHTIVNLYSMSFFVAMNKDVYASLPENLRKIIDENSGERMAMASGKAADLEDLKGAKLAMEQGGEIHILSDQEKERWRGIAMSVGGDWVKEMESKGLPGDKVLSHVSELLISIQ